VYKDKCQVIEILELLFDGLRNIIVESTMFNPLISRTLAVRRILLPGAIGRGLNRALT